MRPSAITAALSVLLATTVVACNRSDGDTSPSISEGPTATAAAPTDAPTVPEATTPDETAPDGVPGVDDAARVAASNAVFASIAADQPGCTAAVARDGVIVWSAAFGAAQLDPLLPMTTETVVDIGSTSKQFTATAIALLVERGELDMATPLADVVPELPDWAATTTIDHLVHHTSGIPDYISLLDEEGFELTEVTTVDDALRVLRETDALEFEPGSRFEYSNSNYFVLSQVVLEVTGVELGAFLDDEVFGPLGLDAVMDPTAVLPGKARSYERDGDDWLPADSPWEQTGDGAVQTTPEQLVIWATEYWAPTVGSEDINTLRFEGAVGADGERYGFGIGELEIDGVRILTHSGGWGGFVTTFVVAPELRLAVAGTCTAPESVPDSEMGDPGFDLLSIWM